MNRAGLVAADAAASSRARNSKAAAGPDRASPRPVFQGGDGLGHPGAGGVRGLLFSALVQIPIQIGLILDNRYLITREVIYIEVCQSAGNRQTSIRNGAQIYIIHHLRLPYYKKNRYSNHDGFGINQRGMESGMIGVFTARWWRAVAMTAIAAGSVLGPQGASAHHSFAQFDQSKSVTLKGTVKSWQFTNPHSWLQLVCIQNGQEVEYGIEGASVSTLVRRGWSRTTFKVGDKVTVEIYPSRDADKKEGALLKATFEDGTTISTGITPA